MLLMDEDGNLLLNEYEDAEYNDVSPDDPPRTVGVSKTISTSSKISITSCIGDELSSSSLSLLPPPRSNDDGSGGNLGKKSVLIVG